MFTEFFKPLCVIKKKKNSSVFFPTCTPNKSKISNFKDTVAIL